MCYINTIILVGGIPTPLKHIKVSWGYYSQYMESHKTCSKPPTRKCWWLRDGLWNWVCHITLRGNPPDFLVKLPLRIHPHFLAVPHVNGKSSFSTTIMTNIGTSSINRGFSIYLKRSTGNPKHDRFWSLLGWYHSNSHFSSHLTPQKSKNNGFLSRFEPRDQGS